MSDVSIDHDEPNSQYLLSLDGEVIGEIVYRDSEGRRIFTHSEVLPQHEGQGYGTRLVQTALDDTLEAGLTPIGQCSMVRHFLTEHPDYAR
jgi:predicted GNAT family acetyltransferase